MVKVIHDKWDIATTAIKQQLIGNRIQLEDDIWKTVKDYYFDFATDTINIIFEEDAVDEPASTFSLKEKFVIELDNTIKPIKNKKRKKQKQIYKF